MKIKPKSALLAIVFLIVATTFNIDFGAFFHDGEVCVYQNTVCWGQNEPELGRYDKLMSLEDYQQEIIINGLLEAGFSKEEILINLVGN